MLNLASNMNVKLAAKTWGVDMCKGIGLRFLITFSLLSSIATGGQHNEAGPASSLPLSRLASWLAGAGLSDVIDIDAEHSVASGHISVQIQANYLELLEDPDSASNLYLKIYSKLLDFTASPPERVALHVTGLGNDWCRTTVIHTDIAMVAGKSLLERHETQPPDAYCSLNFENVNQIAHETRTAVKDAHQKVFMPASVSAPRGMTSEKIKQYLSTRFSQKHASVVVTSVSPNWVALTVGNLRSEVIPDAKYWERLQIMVVLDREQDILRTRLILDGQYASGLRPPSDQGYIDMEPAYTSYLLKYGQAMVLAIGALN